MGSQKIARWIATGFGLGLSPFAPGTVGTLLGIPIAAAFALMAFGWGAQDCLGPSLTLLAVPA